MTALSTLPATGTPTSRARDARAGAATLTGAVLSIAVGATQLLFPQDTTAEIDPRTRVLLVATAALLCLLPVLHARLATSARHPWAPRVASAGTVLLAAGMLSSAVHGEDFSFFPLVAVVANALWFIGSVGTAVSLWRAGRVPRPLAALFVLVMPGTIVLSQLGGGVLVGGYLAVVGWLLLRGQLDSRRR